MNAHNEQQFTAADMADQGAAQFRRGYEAAKAEQSSAAPGIDLEQFRSSVNLAREVMKIAGAKCALPELDRLLALIDASSKGNHFPDATKMAGSAVRALPARWFNVKTGLSAIGCANELTNAIARDDAASPKGGSEARDAARYRWLRDNAAGELHVYRKTDELSLLPSELDADIDAAMQAQASDAEVQP